MRVASHVRGDLWAATLVLALLGPRFLPGPASSPSPLSDVPLPGSASASILASDGPPWLLGTLYSPPSLEVPRGGYGFSETPREPCHSCSRKGRGACGRSSCINMGAGEGPPPESLGEFADDANQGCVLILESLVVSPEVGQGLRGGTGQPGGPGQAAPTAHPRSALSSPLAFTFSSSSSSAAFRSRALRSWNKREGEDEGPGVGEGRRSSMAERGGQRAEGHVRRSVWPSSSRPA